VDAVRGYPHRIGPGLRRRGFADERSVRGRSGLDLEFGRQRHGHSIVQPRHHQLAELLHRPRQQRALAYATGSVGSALSANAGGLVGQNSGSINDVYASGAVTGRAGTTGALVGDNISTGSITNAYIDAAITGSLTAAGTNLGTLQVTATGGTGEPDPTQASTYTSFTFGTIWTIAPGELPTLLHAP
jgi:hypothetical protein